MQLSRNQLLSVSAVILLIFCITYISTGRRQSGTSFQRQEDLGEFLDWSVCETAPSHGAWHDEAPLRCSKAGPEVATCGHGEHKVWRWHDDAGACNVRRATSEDVKGLLRDRWFAVIGDSVGRNLFAAFVRLLADEGRYPVVKGHQDFEYMMPGRIKASFLWAPYTSNATAQLKEWVSNRDGPDVIIFSLGLWHMLHITSVEAFGRDMVALQQAADAFVALRQEKQVAKGTGFQAYRLDICSISALHPEKMKTAQKRENMTPGNVELYNEAIYNSGALVPSGPMHLQDLYNISKGEARWLTMHPFKLEHKDSLQEHSITVLAFPTSHMFMKTSQDSSLDPKARMVFPGCGAECTEDGIHYINAAYDAALQVYINSIHLSSFG